MVALRSFCAMLLLVIGALIISGCAHREFVLEQSDVQGLKVTYSNPKLNVAGMAFHSAYAVKSWKLESHDDSLALLVYLVPASPGSSGSFDIVIDVPASVNRVLFGKLKTEIWRRYVEDGLHLNHAASE